MNITRRNMLTGLVSASFVVGMHISPAWAQKPRWYQKKTVVIGGYDPVAYFTDAKPRKGDSAYNVTYDGGVFYFLSADNKALFESNPEKYAPKYGGYCAYAVSNNYTASITPKAWTIYEGRLYLNYSLGVRKRFLSDVAGHIQRADKNWPGVLG